MKKKRVPAPVYLWRIFDRLESYMTSQGQFFVEICRGTRTELVNIYGDDFRSWAINELTRKHYSITVNAFKEKLEKLRAKIWSKNEVTELYVRVAGDDKTIYYDLYNASGEVVKITPGSVEILSSGDIPIKFLSNGNMKAQVLPAGDESCDLSELRRFFNVKDDAQFQLLMVYIATCFIPGINHPVLIVSGSQGAAKTTTNKLIKRIVDPAYADVVSLPKEKRDLIIQLNYNHMIFYDNIKHISEEYNDVLCQASTGGYQVARKLYTDNELITYKLNKCLMLNGITAITDQPDLLDRAIRIRCERIDDSARLTEKDLYAEFDKILPGVLAEIFCILSSAMLLKDKLTETKLPRMADFAQWGRAIAECIGFGEAEFMRAYEQNRLDIGLELLQSNMTATTVIEYMKETKHWSGSVKSFWTELDRYAAKGNINRNDPTWSRNANMLGKRLEELKVNLAEQGVSFDKRNTGSCKHLEVDWKPR